jgi:putative nucleotidyltransferase-like protein
VAASGVDHVGRRGEPRHGALLRDLIGGIPQSSASLSDDLSGIDMARLSRIAAYHGVDPALYALLAGELKADDPITTSLKRSHRGQVLRHLQVTADAQRLTAAFDAASVDCVIVKGPVLSDTYWGRPGLRRYGDLDVVVHRRQFGLALDTLENAGAQLMDVNWGLIRRQMRGELNLRLPGGTILDLHWHVANDQDVRRRFGFDIDEMLLRRRHVRVAGALLPTWDTADTLLHTALHCTTSGAHRLVWVKDVHLTASGDLDWDAVVQRSEQYRLSVVVGAALNRACRVFGPLPIPPSAQKRLCESAKWLTVTKAVDRTLSPVLQPWKGPTGRAAYQCIRDGDGSTARAFVGSLRVAAAERRGKAAPELVNPLHISDNDASAREEFLRELAAVAEP